MAAHLSFSSATMQGMVGLPNSYESCSSADLPVASNHYVFGCVLLLGNPPHCTTQTFSRPDGAYPSKIFEELWRGFTLAKNSHETRRTAKSQIN